MQEKAAGFNFNIKDSLIYQGIYWEKFPLFKFSSFFKKIFFYLFFIFLFLFLYGFLTEIFSQSTNKRLLAFFSIFFSFWIFFKYLEFFLNDKLRNNIVKTTLEKVLNYPEKYNLADFISFNLAKICYRAIKFSRSRRLLLNSNILFYFILKDKEKINFIFSRLLLDKNSIADFLKNEFLKNNRQEKLDSLFNLDFQKTIMLAFEIAKNKGKQKVEETDVLTALSKENFIFQRILLENDLKTEDIENLSYWIDYLERMINNQKKFWEYENLLKRGTLAKEWTAGYTINLDKYSIDLTEQIKTNLPEIIGHQGELESVERILARNEINNVLLIGEPGTGKKSIIYHLAKKSFLGKSLPEVNYKRIVQLDLLPLLAQLPDIEVVEMVLDKIFQEVVFAGNVILVIDEFHNYVAQSFKPGMIDISGVLSSYLHLPQFQIIAITTYEGLHKNIEQNTSLLNLFEKVEVGEISENETILLLENLVFGLEKKYKIFIPYRSIREIIVLTQKYMPNDRFPDKAIDILDETAIYVAQRSKEKVLLPQHVAFIIKEKTQIPVGEMEIKEKEVLLNLENLIHQRIINQQEAVKEIATALQRARSQISVRKGPM